MPLQSIPCCLAGAGEEEDLAYHFHLRAKKLLKKQRDRGANGGVLDSRKIHSFPIHSFIRSSSYISVIILSSGVLIAVALGIREDNNFQ